MHSKQHEGNTNKIYTFILSLIYHKRAKNMANTISYQLNIRLLQINIIIYNNHVISCNFEYANRYQVILLSSASQLRQSDLLEKSSLRIVFGRRFIISRSKWQIKYCLHSVFINRPLKL